MSVARQILHPPNPSPSSSVIDSVPTTRETYNASEGTRLLCAAAYLDSSFRKEIIRDYIEEEHKAIAPSFGMDQTLVARHCHAADRRLGRRELWLLVPAVFAILALLLGSADESQAVPFLFGSYLAAVAIVLAYKWRYDALLRQNFLRSTFRANAPTPDSKAGLEHIRTAENGNVLIYSGFTPFIGSGINLGGWSFALDLRKTCNVSGQALSPRTSEDRITVKELYDRVHEDINSLDLERVTVEDKLYVNGKDIRDDERFLLDPVLRPLNQVNSQLLADAMLNPSRRLRHYRRIQVVDWSGELVFSIFLRFSKLSHNLFVEASYFLLTPIADRYRRIDTLGQARTFRQGVADICHSVLSAPFLLMFSLYAVCRKMEEGLRRGSRRRAKRKQILEDPLFDYGASLSIRQRTSSDHYQRYFQMLDKDMYAKLLEKNILDSILTILEERNIDVSELKQRQTTILNNGVMVSGGSLTTENLAVGKRAKATKFSQEATQAATA